MSKKYLIEIPDDGNEIKLMKHGYIVRLGESVLINASIKAFDPMPIEVYKATDKKLSHDSIRRWRVLAMLRNIKNHLDLGDDVSDMVNQYLKFSEEIDEEKWEKEYCSKL